MCEWIYFKKMHNHPDVFYRRAGWLSCTPSGHLLSQVWDLVGRSSELHQSTEGRWMQVCKWHAVPVMLWVPPIHGWISSLNCCHYWHSWECCLIDYHWNHIISWEFPWYKGKHRWFLAKWNSNTFYSSTDSAGIRWNPGIPTDSTGIDWNSGIPPESTGIDWNSGIPPESIRIHRNLPSIHYQT